MFVDRKLAENGLVKVMFAPYTKTATAIFDPQVALKSSIKILLEFLVLYIKKKNKFGCKPALFWFLVLYFKTDIG